jgi:NADH dehydrogenase
LDLKLLGKQVVVLGGTGFVGRSVVSELSKQGYKIKIAVRRLERHRDFMLFPQVELVEMKKVTQKNLANLFQDADIVFNLYADTTAKTENIPIEDMAAMAKIIKNEVELSNIQRFLSLSQIGANSNDESNKYSYELEKVDELFMTFIKEGITIAQPSMLIGVGDETTSIISKQMRIQSFVLPIVNAKSLVQPLAIQDFAKVFVAAIIDETTIGQRLIVAGNERLSIKELAILIREMMGKKPAFIYSMGKLGASLVTRLGRLSLLKSVSETFVVTLNKDLITDKKFIDNFGFEPISLEQTLVAYVLDPSMRERYNYFRKEAGRNVEDLA